MSHKQLPDISPNIQLNHNEIAKINRTFPISILAHDIEIAGNVGSLFRVADAFGVNNLYLTGTTAVPPKYKIRKAARSADKRVNYFEASSAIEVVNTLKSKDYMIISLEITSHSMDIRAFTQTETETTNKLKPLCLIIGSEQAGINQQLLDASDYTVHIPMYGENSSMNVATSCAIALYELIRDY